MQTIVIIAAFSAPAFGNLLFVATTDHGPRKRQVGVRDLRVPPSLVRIRRP
jgi:hypothetical protein